jgi:hypothetical protein
MEANQDLIRARNFEWICVTSQPRAENKSFFPEEGDTVLVKYAGGLETLASLYKVKRLIGPVWLYKSSGNQIIGGVTAWKYIPESWGILEE